RARRGSKREQLFELIRQHPDGLARKDILERMGLKGDKSGEMSVSNALNALTTTTEVSRHEGRSRSASLGGSGATCRTGRPAPPPTPRRLNSGIARPPAP